jgi:hypothetical protein
MYSLRDFKSLSKKIGRNWITHCICYDTTTANFRHVGNSNKRWRRICKTDANALFTVTSPLFSAVALGTKRGHRVEGQSPTECIQIGQREYLRCPRNTQDFKPITAQGLIAVTRCWKTLHARRCVARLTDPSSNFADHRGSEEHKLGYAVIEQTW